MGFAAGQAFEHLFTSSFHRPSVLAFFMNKILPFSTVDLAALHSPHHSSPSISLLITSHLQGIVIYYTLHLGS